jgi:hypothetical protein
MFRSIESILRAYRSQAHLTQPQAKTQTADGDDRLAVPVASLVVGYETAAAVAKHYGTQDPWELAEAFGLRVCFEAQPTEARPGERIRSAYLDKPPTAIVYRAPLEELADLIYLHRPNLNVDLLSLHLACVLFQHLERIGMTSISDPLGTIAPAAEARAAARVGRLTRYATSLAAYAFAQALLGLTFFPADLDALYPPRNA